MRETSLSDGPFILGLTGSIAMGKSVAAGMFRDLGVPVFDADAVVHGLLELGGAGVAPVSSAFQGVEKNGAIDRQALGAAVFGRPQELRRLEKILHPLVGRARARFLRQHTQRRTPIVVLDIPLLFETGGARRCDAVAVVSAPAFLQRRRALARPGMTAAKLDAILAQQVPDAEKRHHADYVIPSGLGRAPTRQAIRALLAELTRMTIGGSRCARS